MTNYGYTLPDPNVPNRFTIFFTGGLLEPNDETDLNEWKNTFGADAPKRSLADRARLLAAKILLGATVSDTMEADGSMSYYLKRPIGAHGATYMDVSVEWHHKAKFQLYQQKDNCRNVFFVILLSPSFLSTSISHSRFYM
jgi:hypothetical protein